MSDTPETNSIIRNAQAADHPPTRLAATLTVKCEKLERERDEAREKIKRQADIGCSFQKTNPAMCGRYKQERDEAQEKYATEATEHMLAVNKVCNERDEAREKAERYRLEANAIMMQRDEARERVEQQRKEIVRLNGATNHAGGTPLKIALRERDEALFLLKAAQSALDAIHLEVGDWIKILKENTD